MKRIPSRKITDALAAHIKYLVGLGTRWRHEVAAVVGVNPGRVSEVMNYPEYAHISPARGPFPV